MKWSDMSSIERQKHIDSCVANTEARAFPIIENLNGLVSVLDYKPLPGTLSENVLRDVEGLNNVRGYELFLLRNAVGNSLFPPHTPSYFIGVRFVRKVEDETSQEVKQDTSSKTITIPQRRGLVSRVEKMTDEGFVVHPDYPDYTPMHTPLELSELLNIQGYIRLFDNIHTLEDLTEWSSIYETFIAPNKRDFSVHKPNSATYVLASKNVTPGNVTTSINFLKAPYVLKDVKDPQAIILVNATRRISRKDDYSNDGPLYGLALRVEPNTTDPSRINISEEVVRVFGKRTHTDPELSRYFSSETYLRMLGNVKSADDIVTLSEGLHKFFS